jgi:hypothetical protein
VLAMIPCYWAWRSGDLVMDFFILFHPLTRSSDGWSDVPTRR